MAGEYEKLSPIGKVLVSPLIVLYPIGWAACLIIGAVAKLPSIPTPKSVLRQRELEAEVAAIKAYHKTCDPGCNWPGHPRSDQTID